MSLLPSFLLDEEEDELLEEQQEDLELKEYGIDFETGLLTGEIVEAREALKVWIWLALHCERYRHPIYSWDYGVELDQYIGQRYSEEYINSALRNDVEECLLQNPHIQAMTEFKASFSGDTITMEIKLDTDLGEVEMDV